MRKVAEYFGQTATYGTDIQYTITKESTKVTARPVKVNTGDADIDKMMLGKQLSEWVLRTVKLSANMGQTYNVIIGQSTNSTRSKLDSLKGWEAMLESLDLIALMKGIKVLIFRHNDTKYFYMGMHSALCGFLNLHQGGMTVAEYHKRWTANKDLAEDFGYKVGESDRATNWECEASDIKTSDKDYNENRVDASEVAREKFLAATFLLRADIHQYGGRITHPRNDYAKVQQTYP